MRLIDADRLKERVLKWLPSDPCGIGEKEHPIETDIVVSLMMEIEEAPTVGEWIPVSERLPSDKTYVLTTIQVNGRQPHARSGFYHGGFFHNDNGEIWRETEPPLKAWMPLPEPYKGETNGKM